MTLVRKFPLTVLALLVKRGSMLIVAFLGIEASLGEAAESDDLEEQRVGFSKALPAVTINCALWKASDPLPPTLWPAVDSSERLLAP